MSRTWLLFGALALGCRPCEDDCVEFVELSFASSAADGSFASTRYFIVVSADGNVADCEIEVSTPIGDQQPCQGDAVVSISDGSTDDTDGGTGGGSLRVVLRWDFAPAEFDLVVRDAAKTLVLTNTLTPAYQDQGVDSCAGGCRRFEQEIVVP